ncbi:MAG: prepilin-type N-terminal cleavage/methylation domain-containing protein [Acidimicrobiales bacterium]
MSSIKGRLHNLETRSEQGFTLIELLVVLLIIGILLAVAIPIFLTVTKSANNTTVQANLQTALTGANAYWTQEGQTYSGIDSSGNPAVSNISDIDTGVNYVSGTNSSGLNVVSLWTDGSTSLVLSAWAPGTHDCWSILDLKAPTTIWGQSLDMGTYYALDANVGAADCVADGTAAPTTGTLTGPQQGGFPSA